MTSEQLIQGLKDWKSLMRLNRGVLMEKTVAAILPVYKQRIFGGGFDADMGYIGEYRSKIWVQERLKKGLQVDYVDLKFSGKLYDAIKAQKDGYDAVAAIPKDKEYQKAIEQEVLQGEKKGGPGRRMDIFSLTDQEVEIAENRMLENLAALIRDTIVA